MAEEGKEKHAMSHATSQERTCINWVTNDPQAARALRKADKEFEAARIAASTLPLADKIVALRAAKEARQAAYAKVSR